MIDYMSQWLTTYEATLLVRGEGKAVSTASIRRACEAGAIPLAERHAIGNNRDLWLIPQGALIAWMAEGMPGRHHYEVALIRSGKRQIPERLRKAGDHGVCRRCGHSLEPGVTDWPAKGRSGDLVIVRNTPALVCPQCGEATAASGVLEHMNQLIADGGGEIAQHRVVPYEPLPEDAGSGGNP